MSPARYNRRDFVRCVLLVALALEAVALVALPVFFPLR